MEQGSVEYATMLLLSTLAKDPTMSVITEHKFRVLLPLASI